MHVSRKEKKGVGGLCDSNKSNESFKNRTSLFRKEDEIREQCMYGLIVCACVIVYNLSHQAAKKKKVTTFRREVALLNFCNRF